MISLVETSLSQFETSESHCMGKDLQISAVLISHPLSGINVIGLDAGVCLLTRLRVAQGLVYLVNPSEELANCF